MDNKFGDWAENGSRDSVVNVIRHGPGNRSWNRVKTRRSPIHFAIRYSPSKELRSGHIATA